MRPGLFWPEVKSRFGDTLTERSFTDDDAAFRWRDRPRNAHPRRAALRRFAGERSYRRIGVSTRGAMVRQLMKHALPPGSPPAGPATPCLHPAIRAAGDRLAIVEEVPALADELAPPVKMDDRP